MENLSFVALILKAMRSSFSFNALSFSTSHGFGPLWIDLFMFLKESFLLMLVLEKGKERTSCYPWEGRMN